MFLKPAKLGEKEIPEKILSEDRKHCKKIGPCGIGKEALYLNSFYLERRYYVPVSSVSRVFKRVAMSKGGFTGKGLFATMPYLVVVLDDGSEKQCNFKYEDQVDAFVSAVKERFPQVKTVSEAAEKRLAEAAHSPFGTGKRECWHSGAGKGKALEADVPVYGTHKCGKEKENL